MKNSKAIDLYIKAAPKEAQTLLKQMRASIQKVAPKATEVISYKIPTFKLGRNLVHFAAFKDHISFFPTSSGVAAFKKELAKYKVAKGTIQFPIDKPLPLALVQKITIFRVKEESQRLEKKGQKVCSRGHIYHQGSGACLVCWPGRVQNKSTPKAF